ncbi:hypothetical protein SAMN04487912_103400 [Arthrobacter sp. cf158]|nr:hypothetical protein SAMN04487912_103400 [Arthrobacter sp. cf158]
MAEVPGTLKVPGTWRLKTLGKGRVLYGLMEGLHACNANH